MADENPQLPLQAGLGHSRRSPGVSQRLEPFQSRPALDGLGSGFLIGLEIGLT